MLLMLVVPSVKRSCCKKRMAGGVKSAKKTFGSPDWKYILTMGINDSTSQIFFNTFDETGKIILLIKPQFEVGRGEVGKGGIVREAEKHERVIAEVNNFAAACGLITAKVIDSPITGADGNKEFLALYEKARFVEADKREYCV